MTEYIFFLTQRFFPFHSVFAIESVIFRQRLFCIFVLFFGLVVRREAAHVTHSKSKHYSQKKILLPPRLVGRGLGGGQVGGGRGGGL